MSKVQTDAVVERSTMAMDCRECRRVRQMDVRHYADGKKVATCPVCFEERSWKQ